MFKKKNSMKFFTLAAITSLLSTGCSKTPDVRLTMCQDLTSAFLSTPTDLQWTEHKPIFNGYEDLEMRIHFTSAAGSGQASCFYAYNQVEPDAEAFNTPTTDYSTYPNRMILQGKDIDKQQLARGVNQVMIKQGKEAVYKIQENVANFEENVKENVNKAKENITNVSQEVGEKVRENVHKAGEKLAEKLKEY